MWWVNSTLEKAGKNLVFYSVKKAYIVPQCHKWPQKHIDIFNKVWQKSKDIERQTSSSVVCPQWQALLIVSHKKNSDTTAKCRYYMVRYNMILHVVRQWMRQNINQRLHSQKTHHTPLSRACYGVFLVRIQDKFDRVIQASRYIWSLLALVGASLLCLGMWHMTKLKLIYPRVIRYQQSITESQIYINNDNKKR